MFFHILSTSTLLLTVYSSILLHGSVATLLCTEDNAPLEIIRHPDDCGLFIYCIAPGIVLDLPCPAGLAFHPHSLACVDPWQLTTSDPCYRRDTDGQAATTAATKTEITTADCDPSLCQLPSCFCFGWKPSDLPSLSLTLRDIPQMVMLTFDDSIREQEYERVFSRLFDGSTTNPDGCPIRATFYVSHFYTDYSLMTELYQAGHEMATHTFTHRTPISFYKDASYQQWVEEMGEERETFETLGLVPGERVTGSRAPYLQTSGHTYFSMLSDLNYTYDTSVGFWYNVRHRPPTGPAQDRGPLWPFTLDYLLPDEYRSAGCSVPPCPAESVPGLWEIPLQAREDNQYQTRCLLLDDCFVPTTRETMKSFLYSIFDQHYNGTRAPMLLPMHAAKWLPGSEQVDGMLEFLREITSLPGGDVYVVTMDEVIRWMRQPVATRDLDRSGVFSSTCRQSQPAACPTRTYCQYSLAGPDKPSYLIDDSFSTLTCAPACPTNYPLPGNPRGL